MRAKPPRRAWPALLDRWRPGRAIGAGEALLDLAARSPAISPELMRELREAVASWDAREPTGEGLLSRDAFVLAVQALLDAAPGQPLAVGVFRLSELDRLALTDPGADLRVLEAFGARLRKTSDAAQPVARWDGATFAVALPGLDAPEAGERRLRALSYVLRQEIEGGGLPFIPELHAGAAAHPADGEGAAELVRRACASAQPRGASEGAAVSFSTPATRAAERERFALKQELHSVIGRGELRLQYQPVVDLAAGRVVAAEALLRWRRASGEEVSPSRFIPLLEESALVEEVGLWTFNAVCRQVRAWDEAGLGDLRVAVNLSARQFRDPQLAQTLARLLELHGVRPAQLEVELTETAAMQDADGVRALLGELHALGVGVAIDDFGSGYSSMSYLKNLPFTKLKIDREFVTDVDRRADSRAICKALIELSRGLGISVLAEGAERREEVDVLHALGCPLFQGFYFSRPLDPAAFVARLADAEWLTRLASPVHRRLADLQRDLRRPSLVSGAG